MTGMKNILNRPRKIRVDLDFLKKSINSIIRILVPSEEIAITPQKYIL